jgi:thiol-disulfide isomerase/thioredoxin
MRLFLAVLVAAAATAASAGGAGLPTPPLSGVDPITGKHVRLADFRGRLVIVNFWASWCSGCQVEAGALAFFVRQHPGVVLLGIDTQDSKTGARAFYKQFGLRYPSIFDPKGIYAEKLSVAGLPTTYFLNSQHQIVANITGSASLAQLELGLATARSN